MLLISSRILLSSDVNKEESARYNIQITKITSAVLFFILIAVRYEISLKVLLKIRTSSRTAPFLLIFHTASKKCGATTSNISIAF